MEREIITSRKNPLMTHLRKLASSRAYRTEQSEFLCDGVKLLDEAVHAAAPILTVVHTERVELPVLDRRVRVVCVPEDVMRSMTDFTLRPEPLMRWRDAIADRISGE